MSCANDSGSGGSFEMVKYPRTHHLQGSKLQPGDEDLSQVRLSELAGAHLVIEEKLDGANAAFSFDVEGRLLLQSRGHYLTGGPREKHFAMFKTWAATHCEALHAAVGHRYVVYGEWLYAKHTVFYDRLPHWFLEFDCWDREAQEFLSTERRVELLQHAPVCHVPVVHRGTVARVDELRALVTTSLYKTPRWRERLAEVAEELGLDVERVQHQTDPRPTSEGLYLKHEEGGRVVGRYKWIRDSFLQSVQVSDSHWLNRPIVPNQLAEGVDIFAPECEKPERGTRAP